MGEDDRACSFATGIDRIEEAKRQKRKRRGGRCDGALSKSRDKEVWEEPVETDSDTKAERAGGSDFEVDEARASDHTVDSPRTESINRLRWLIDNSSTFFDGRRGPKSKR